MPRKRTQNVKKTIDDTQYAQKYHHRTRTAYGKWVETNGEPTNRYQWNKLFKNLTEFFCENRLDRFRTEKNDLCEVFQAAIKALGKQEVSELLYDVVYHIQPCVVNVNYPDTGYVQKTRWYVHITDIVGIEFDIE